MSEPEAFSADVERAAALLLKAVSSAAPPQAAFLSTLAQIVPTAVIDSKDGNEKSFRPLNADERQLVDAAARAALAQMVAASIAAGSPVMQWRQAATDAAAAVPRLLDMALLTSEHRSLDPGLAFALLEDLVETSIISDAGEVFTYLETHMAALQQPRAKASGKHYMLRTCNQLLRRLSKGANAVLCGRILIFLARLLPLSDRSGINLQGAFNTANTTPLEDVQEGATDTNGEAIDVEFYRRFWGLQSVFQAPGAHMPPQPWAAAVNDLKLVLAEFQKQRVIAAASSAPASDSLEVPTVKYLSSSKLMRLQLQDAAFRRQFLIQALIFLHSCQHPGRLEKNTLKSKQLEEAVALEAALYKQLESTPERGAEFAAAVKAVLRDETHWAQWKREGAGPKKETCQPFERSAYVPPAEPAAQPSTGPPARKRQRLDVNGNARLRLGTPALDRLWNQAPNNMAGLRVEERKHLPTLREFLNPVIEDMDPENCIEDEFRRKHDKVYQWKALRMISRESLPIFSKTAYHNDLEQAARGLFPDETPPEEQPAAAAAAQQHNDAPTEPQDAAADAKDSPAVPSDKGAAAADADAAAAAEAAADAPTAAGDQRPAAAVAAATAAEPAEDAAADEQSPVAMDAEEGQLPNGTATAAAAETMTQQSGGDAGPKKRKRPADAAGDGAAAQ